MTTPWSAGEGPAIPGLPGAVTLVEGSTFCISQSSGDILPGEKHQHGSRFLVSHGRILLPRRP